jgi:hypothetical protein
VTARKTAPPGAELRHGAVFYNDPDELARLTEPWLREAVFAGEPVVAVLDEDCQRAVRDLLGADADAVRFTAAVRDETGNPQAVVTRTRRLVEDLTRHGGRLTLLEQAPPDAAPDDTRIWESAYNLVLAHHPATLLCAWRTDLDERLITAVERSHPLVCTDGRILANLAYSDPAALLEEHVLGALSPMADQKGTVEFSSTGDLGRVRRVVADHAGRTELDRERTDALLIAVNEAATITLFRAAGEVSCVEVATTADAITCDVRGSRPFTGLSAMGLEDENLWWVHEFSDRTEVGNDGDTGVIRVVMTLDGS